MPVNSELGYDLGFDDEFCYGKDEDIPNSHCTGATVDQSTNSCTTPLKRLVHRKYWFKEKQKLELRQELFNFESNFNT